MWIFSWCSGTKDWIFVPYDSLQVLLTKGKTTLAKILEPPFHLEFDYVKGILEKDKIPYYHLLQQPGDCIYVPPGCAHVTKVF